MTRVFADTFYYLALLNAADDAHQACADFTIEFSGTMVTTDFVLIELADGLAGSRTRQVVIEFIASLRGDPAIRVVAGTPKLLTRGWDLYRRRADKEWSLTDCISFVVMSEMRIKDALTGDHHFEQAGFHALLQ
jgi:hypothetical protein